MDELEIPSWASEISSASLDQLAAQPIDNNLGNPSAFIFDQEEESPDGDPNEEEPKKKRKRGLFRKNREGTEEAPESGSERIAEPEPNKKSKRKSRKEKQDGNRKPRAWGNSWDREIPAR